jgi:hypothetical protein
MPFVRFPSELFALRDVAAMAVMLRVILRMDADGNGVCFETRASMCKELGIDKNTWKKKIDLLESQGLINVVRHRNVPHHITLTDKMKDYLGVKNHPLAKFNMDLDRGRNFTPSTTTEEEGKRVSRPRRSTIKIKKPKSSSDPILSEVDAIHRRWLKKSDD